jgi:hypothetical protein
MPNEVRERIFNYVNCLDKNYATKTYEEFGISETIQELIACFTDPITLTELSSVRCFLRDGLSSQLPFVKEIQSSIKNSPLPHVIYERLITSHSSERNIIIDSMRTNMPGQKENFNAAFLHFRDIDPLLMPVLLREAGWTKATEGFEFHWQLLNSPCYLSRWSVAESDFVSGPDTQLLEKLINDPHPRVRREAIYWQSLLWRNDQCHAFTKAENRKKRKEIEATRPLTFADLSLLFWKYKCQKGQEIWSYTVEELSAFEQTLPELYRWK